jgi:hypothetical protein
MSFCIIHVTSHFLPTANFLKKKLFLDETYIMNLGCFVDYAFIKMSFCYSYSLAMKKKACKKLQSNYPKETIMLGKLILLTHEIMQGFIY